MWWTIELICCYNNYNLTTVKNHNINIYFAGYLKTDSFELVDQPPNGAVRFRLRIPAKDTFSNKNEWEKHAMKLKNSEGGKKMDIRYSYIES